jgi:hypothetical protein
MRSSIAIGAVAAALLAPAAQAAEPSTGYVGADRLSQAWSGEAYGQPFKGLPELQQRCDAPFCDEFTLEVRDVGRLTILANVPDSAQFVDLEVLRPDGVTERIDGNEEDDFAKLEIPAAAKGRYRIRVWPNKLPVLYQPQYTGSAKLVLPPPPEPAQGA